MQEHGVGDQATIKEIIDEVDSDNVSWLLFLSVIQFSCTIV